MSDNEELDDEFADYEADDDDEIEDEEEDEEDDGFDDDDLAACRNSSIFSRCGFRRRRARRFAGL